MNDANDKLRREFEAGEIERGTRAKDLADRDPYKPESYWSTPVECRWRGFQYAAAPRDKLIEELAGALQRLYLILKGTTLAADAPKGMAMASSALAHYAASKAAKREEYQ